MHNSYHLDLVALDRDRSQSDRVDFLSDLDDSQLDRGTSQLGRVDFQSDRVDFRLDQDH